MVHREHLNSYETHALDNADDRSWAVLGVFNFHEKLLSHGMESGLGENSDHLSVEVRNFLHVVDIGVGEVGTAVCVCVCVCCIKSVTYHNQQTHTLYACIIECNNNTQFSFKLHLRNKKTSPINRRYYHKSITLPLEDKFLHSSKSLDQDVLNNSLHSALTFP